MSTTTCSVCLPNLGDSVSCDTLPRNRCVTCVKYIITDESSPYTIPQNGEPTGLTEADVITVQQNAAGSLRVSLSLLFFPSPKTGGSKGVQIGL